MFGTQANQRILVRFLNALFSDEFTVTKVECSDQLSNFLRGFSQIVEFIKANSFVAQRLKNWHE